MNLLINPQAQTMAILFCCRVWEWVDWFNNRRILEPVDNIPPAEAEKNYHAMLDESHMAE